MSRRLKAALLQKLDHIFDVLSADAYWLSDMPMAIPDGFKVAKVDSVGRCFQNVGGARCK